MSLAVSSLYVMPNEFSQSVVAQAKGGQSGAAFDQKVISRISAERIYEDVHYLSEVIGPRVTGTEEEKFTANYIKERLLSYGYEVEVQNFSIPDKKVGHLQTSNGDEVLVNAALGSASTTEDGLTAELYDAGLGYPADFNEDAAGKIALISRGEITFQVKVENALAAGSVGVLNLR